jgi:hypothetical protein
MAGDWNVDGRSSAFSVRMAGSAPQCGKAVGPPIGGVGLAQQDWALFGLQVSLRCQLSKVLGVGAPLPHRLSDADCRDPLHAVVFHGIPYRGLSGGREEAAAPGADAVRSPR